VPLLSKGDVIIDGGNSNYNDTLARAKKLKAHGIQLVDVGTSGGVWGAERGYSLMIGGPKRVVRKLTPLFETLAPAADKGWGHVGPAGAGHRAKMIHNGIEYGMMRALAEGLMLAASGKRGGKGKGKADDLKLDPAQLTRVWQHGSVVSSWLLDLTAQGLSQNPALKGIGTVVPDSGEGRGTVQDAVERGVPVPVISQALMSRFASQVADRATANKLEQLMRAMFGGHAIVPGKGDSGGKKQ
jgi:6-phosphogluconate dehydrogenase